MKNNSNLMDLKPGPRLESGESALIEQTQDFVDGTKSSSTGLKSFKGSFKESPSLLKTEEVETSQH